MKSTWEKVFEYASMPVHGSLSRKLRKGVRLQINEGKIYADATMFLGEEFIRLTEVEKKETINSYYDWDKVVSVRTFSQPE